MEKVTKEIQIDFKKLIFWRDDQQTKILEAAEEKQKI